MRRIAIYDLDKTLTRRPTFTPFLIFAAARGGPVRRLLLPFVLLPVWIVAMGLYKAGLYSRTALKTFGMHLMVGRRSPQELARLGTAFARRHLERGGTMPATMHLLEEDRRRGNTVVIATAAFGFYAEAFARAFGVEHVIATRWDGRAIPGGNCYGAEKHARVLAWLDGATGPREGLHLRFVSDSFADAPLLDEADEPIFVSRDAGKRDRARHRGWPAIDGLQSSAALGGSPETAA